MNTCFLRNTRSKSASRPCGKGASSLRLRSVDLMSAMRRRGASPCCAVRVNASHRWIGERRFFGERGARGSSIGADRTRRIRNPLTRNNVWRFNMKMVKSLLLGSAAGLVAVAGAQAADLPVKAKPVQYVKICSLYGAGFYYIPGTDTCLKVGGWVRQYIGVNANGNLTNGALGSLNTNTRGSNNGWNWKARGYITADARTQTEFGTLRGYISVGASTQGQAGNSAFNSNRAFIQLAGFTFGVAQSFYDLYPAPALSYFGGMINPSSDTGDGGQTVTAYTAQFGNGFSATLSLEAPRTTTVFNAVPGFVGGGAGGFLSSSGASGALTQSSGNVRYPDIVGNLRMDASWGAAQIMGGIHDVVPGYYGTAINSTTAATTATGNPAFATGFFVGAGAKINFPSIGPGDYFSFQVNYTQGALGYLDDGATTGAGVIAPP